MLKKTAVWIVPLVVGSLLFGCGGNEIAATVNGKKIYMKEVEDQLALIKKQHGGSQKTQTKEMEDRFKKSILNYLIENELALQEAERLKLEATNKEAEEQISQAKQKLGSQSAFDAFLKQQSLTLKEFKEQTKEGIALDKLSKIVYANISVSDEEIKNYYQQNQSTFVDPAQAKLRQIILGTKNKAKQIQTQARGGADFAELAKKNSIDVMTRDNGGDLGLKGKADLASELADPVFKLKAGEVSDVIEYKGNFYIIKVEEKKEARQKSYDETKEEIRQILLSQKQKKAYDKWMSKLKAKAKIVKYI